jgi:hypothetical protein
MNFKTIGLLAVPLQPSRSQQIDPRKAEEKERRRIVPVRALELAWNSVALKWFGMDTSGIES